MNLINFNQVIEALDKERQLLLNREQYGAENVLVHHAINVIAELPIIRQPEIVLCKDCKYGEPMCQPWSDIICTQNRATHIPDWFCADGERREENENGV